MAQPSDCFPDAAENLSLRLEQLRARTEPPPLALKNKLLGDFRKLREDLLSSRASASVAIRIYEASAEARHAHLYYIVFLSAGSLLCDDISEYLRCQTNLINDWYPQASVASKQSECYWSCMALLFFSACYPSNSDFESTFFKVSHLRSTNEVSFALRVAESIRFCDYCLLSKLWTKADNLQRILLRPALSKIHTSAFRTFILAYFDLPLAFVSASLCLPTDAVISLAESHGCPTKGDVIIFRQRRAK